jgi:magnesium chelatase family protein
MRPGPRRCRKTFPSWRRTRCPQVIEYLNGEQALDRVEVDAQAEFGRSRSYDMGLSEIRSQQHAKRAMEVACAGGHNILML